MINEFARKSSSKRKNIFIGRTEKLMGFLVDDFFMKVEHKISKDERKVIIADLVRDVFEKTNLKKDKIMTAAKVEDLSSEDLVSYLLAKLNPEEK